MSKLKLSLEIEIKKIEVDEYYYNIDFIYIINGKPKKGTYESDYDGWTIKEWEKELEKGEALALILQQISDNYGE